MTTYASILIADVEFLVRVPSLPASPAGSVPSPVTADVAARDQATGHLRPSRSLRGSADTPTSLAGEGSG